MKEKYIKILSWAFLYFIALLFLFAYAYEIFSVSRAINDRHLELSLSEQNFLLLLAAALPLGQICSKINISNVNHKQNIRIRVGILLALLASLLSCGFFIQKYYKGKLIRAQYAECINERHTGLRSNIKIFKRSPLLCK